METSTDLWADINTIRSIGVPAILEQLAEEASELAQSALKLARIYRDENPTPVKSNDAIKSLQEEYTDVLLAANAAGIVENTDIYHYKIARWAHRIRQSR